MWQGWRDSNPQPSVLETAVLPIGTTPLKSFTIPHLREILKFQLHQPWVILDFSGKILKH